MAVTGTAFIEKELAAIEAAKQRLLKVVRKMKRVKLDAALAELPAMQEGDVFVGVMPPDIARLWVLYNQTKIAHTEHHAKYDGTGPTPAKRLAVIKEHREIMTEEMYLGTLLNGSLITAFPNLVRYEPVTYGTIKIRQGWNIVIPAPAAEKNLGPLGPHPLSGFFDMFNGGPMERPFGGRQRMSPEPDGMESLFSLLDLLNINRAERSADGDNMPGDNFDDELVLVLDLNNHS